MRSQLSNKVDLSKLCPIISETCLFNKISFALFVRNKPDIWQNFTPPAAAEIVINDK